MTEKNSTKDRIKRLLINVLELNLNADELEENGLLDELFGLDSVAVIEFILGIEKEFRINIDPETISIDLLKDLSRLSDYIENLIGKLNP